MQDKLGERIKSQYEHRTRHLLPRRTYTIIRLDGKAFHTYTKNLEKPFDYDLMTDLNDAVKNIMDQIQGAKFAYVQSDEISILLTDFENDATDAWFDGNIQKITSVSVSLLTAEFNKLRILRSLYDTPTVERGMHTIFQNCVHLNKVSDIKLAHFDSRVFTIPDRTEVMNYFIWRNNDASRNSVSMVAQSKFSHEELQNKSTAEMKAMLTSMNHPWELYYNICKYGGLITKENYMINRPIDSSIEPMMRSRWIASDAWKFTDDKVRLKDMIPNYK